jgi:hypothetical protein
VGGYFGAGTLNFGGSTITGAAQFNAFVASASPSRAHRWARLLSGADETTYNQCNGIAIDGNGNGHRACRCVEQPELVQLGADATTVDIDELGHGPPQSLLVQSIRRAAV